MFICYDFKKYTIEGVFVERIMAYAMSIKFTKEEMDNMESMLKLFLEKNNINLEPPVDIFKLATELGFDVRGAEFDDNLDGLLLVNETVDIIEPFTSNKIIAYNCQKTLEHKKFIVGHELAHYIDAKSQDPENKIVCAARDHSEPYSDDRNEQMKDYISAAILMTRDYVINKYKNVADKTSQHFYNKVISDFNVTAIPPVTSLF